VSLGGTRKLRVVPRVAGDTTPLDPAIAEALRKAGLDPLKYTTTPLEGAGAANVPGLPQAGSRVAHSFRFATLNGALAAIERLVDRDVGARIDKEAEEWLVTFDAPLTPDVDDAAAHQRFAREATAVGGRDAGVMRETVTRSVKVERRS